jgi:nucleotide-binding universal stress UspA family protein
LTPELDRFDRFALCQRASFSSDFGGGSALAEVEWLSSHGSPIAVIIASYAMNRGVDLIVIGA